MKNLNGKVVVITGAASGIGLEMARAFAREGSKLALADINAQGLEEVRKQFEAPGRTVYTQVVDVSKKEQVKDLCDKVYEKMGRVDVLCNNAGIATAGKFENLPMDSWCENSCKLVFIEWIIAVCAFPYRSDNTRFRYSG